MTWWIMNFFISPNVKGKENYTCNLKYPSCVREIGAGHIELLIQKQSGYNTNVSYLQLLTRTTYSINNI